MDLECQSKNETQNEEGTLLRRVSNQNSRICKRPAASVTTPYPPLHVCQRALVGRFLKEGMESAALTLFLLTAKLHFTDCGKCFICYWWGYAHKDASL